MDFAGKNVVVIGGFGGIGLETVKELLKENIARMAILDKTANTDVLEDLKRGNPNKSVIFLPLNITKNTEVNNVIQNVYTNFGYIDILVNAAGVARDNDPEYTVAVNLIGTINSTLYTYKYMDKNKWGKGGLIVNIASVLGIWPVMLAPVYTATKSGVVGFTRSLAITENYEKTGVGVMVICPAYTDTNMTKSLFEWYFADENPNPGKYFLQKQSAQDCAKSIVKAIATNKNGSVWVCYAGTLKLVDPDRTEEVFSTICHQ